MAVTNIFKQMVEGDWKSMTTFIFLVFQIEMSRQK